MPPLPMDRNPRHSRHASGLGVVYLSGKAHYTAKWGTPEADQKYAALVMRWNAGGRRPLERDGDPESTIGSLIDRYDREVLSRYVKRGRPTTEAVRARRCLEVVRTMFGNDRAASLDRDAFRTLIDHFGRQPGRGGQPMARKTIAKYLGQVRRFGIWCEQEGRMPWQSWFLSQGCPVPKRMGRKTADVPPAPPRAVAAVLAIARPSYAAMIRLQLATGMRPAEVCAIRPRDLDRSREPWVYRVPAEWNKTEHHEIDRVVFLGPKAREILGPHLDGCPPGRAVFLTRFGDPIRPGGYNGAIARMCRRAGVERWSSNQLRHSAATAVRRSDGLEAASALLGHADLETTKLYAARDEKLAEETAEKFG